MSDPDLIVDAIIEIPRGAVTNTSMILKEAI